jgi:uncharacterized protein (TIGR02246 family)
MRLVCFLIVFFVSSRTFCQEDKIYPVKDLDALRALPATWEKDWNNHNIDSLGNMFREDVDFVNLAGVWLKGKTASVKLLKMVHQSTFKNSVWTTDSVDVKYVKPDLAIVHIGWGLRGDVNVDGSTRKQKHGIFTWVVIREKGQWQLLTIDNVTIIEAPSSTK